MSNARPDELTLADLVLRQTYGKPKRSGMAHISVRAPLFAARRFVLDQDASAFLCDLANANFFRQHVSRALRAYEASRVLARLPHAVTWIEYDAIAESARHQAAYSASASPHSFAKPNKIFPPPIRMGWLLRQHPHIETAFRMTQFIDCGDNAAHMQPFDMVWVTDDGILPWPEDVIPKKDPLDMTTVALSFVIDFVNDDEFHLVKPPEGFHGVGVRKNAVTKLVSPQNDARSVGRDAAALQTQRLIYSGAELRKALTLLSAINDVPTGVKHVELAHGFFAQGRYRKFLDHHIVTITLPKGRDPQKVARDVIAKARRRAHQVRGHWRRDWRHEGLRIWVHEHQRGDASLGFVTHDYRVEYPAADEAAP
jgi:hypothetical protein